MEASESDFRYAPRTGPVPWPSSTLRSTTAVQSTVISPFGFSTRTWTNRFPVTSSFVVSYGTDAVTFRSDTLWTSSAYGVGIHASRRFAPSGAAGIFVL